MKNKKRALLPIITFLSISAIMCTLFNKKSLLNTFAQGNRQEHSSNCNYYHYDAVEPTEDSHGSKEFWACCLHHSFLLEEPDSGTIIDAGSFSGHYFDSLSEDDERYIAPLPKTRTIHFYCDNFLCETVFVKDGDKIESINSDDFVFDGWYTENELINEWDFENDSVMGDLNLFAKYTALEKQINVNYLDAPVIDDYGFGRTIGQNELCISKGENANLSFAVLQSRGILFNKKIIGDLGLLSVDIDSEGFSSAKVFFGNSPLSIDNFVELIPGNNVIDLTGFDYFTIQNESLNSITIKTVDIVYKIKTIFDTNTLPKLFINTENQQQVLSRVDYVSCEISTDSDFKDVDGIKGKIKVRGNSTSSCPKKPYRIKLDKKTSLFGYEKAKNWVLLADYMDGSNMHNYSALQFAKMIRGEETFGANPLHVKVVLNNEEIGLYCFCEHIEAKTGRLGIEQEMIWGKDFNDINFYIERDSKTLTDPEEIENETFFQVPLDNYYVDNYVFALKYPEKEDFEEELEDGSIISHDEEFYSFFNSLRIYMTDICERFVNYYHDFSHFSEIAEFVDVESLALFGVVDQVFRESDHGLYSFKMYRVNGGLLQFGPNWDYDSSAYGLPYQGTYVLNPFDVGTIPSFQSVYFAEKWSYTLFNDRTNGFQLFESVWNKISNDDISTYINAQMQEMNFIAEASINDCGIWMSNQYYCLFDNRLYHSSYLNGQLSYLLNYYA